MPTRKECLEIALAPKATNQQIDQMVMECFIPPPHPCPANPYSSDMAWAWGLRRLLAERYWDSDDEVVRQSDGRLEYHFCFRKSTQHPSVQNKTGKEALSVLLGAQYGYNGKGENATRIIAKSALKLYLAELLTEDGGEGPTQLKLTTSLRQGIKIVEPDVEVQAGREAPGPIVPFPTRIFTHVSDVPAIKVYNVKAEGTIVPDTQEKP